MLNPTADRDDVEGIKKGFIEQVGRIPDTWGDHAGPSHLVAVVGFLFRRHLRNWRDEGDDEGAVDNEDEAESGDEWSRGCPDGFYSRWRRKTAMERTRHPAETRLRSRTLPQCVGSSSGRRPSRSSAGGVSKCS
ncbi:unnamed protein product [Boreogadus saida]